MVKSNWKWRYYLWSETVNCKLWYCFYNGINLNISINSITKKQRWVNQSMNRSSHFKPYSTTIEPQWYDSSHFETVSTHETKLMQAIYRKDYIGTYTVLGLEDLILSVNFSTSCRFCTTASSLWISNRCILARGSHSRRVWTLIFTRDCTWLLNEGCCWPLRPWDSLCLLKFCFQAFSVLSYLEVGPLLLIILFLKVC